MPTLPARRASDAPTLYATAHTSPALPETTATLAGPRTALHRPGRRPRAPGYFRLYDILLDLLSSLFLLALFIPGFLKEAAAMVCNGAPEALIFGIDAPEDPQPYVLPVGPTVRHVSTTAELQRALAWDSGQNGVQLDIILHPGVYTPAALDNGRYLRLYGSHRLWAESLGGVILQFGIDAGGYNKRPASGPQNYSAGAQFHGLVFDIKSANHAPHIPDGDPESVDTYALVAWGDSQHLRVEDSVFVGNGVVGWGIRSTSPEGFVARRLRITGFLVHGIAVSQLPNAPDLGTPARLTDLRVTDINDPQHEPLWGENGIWLAATGSLERAYIRRVHRAGVLTGGNLRNGVVRDIDVDDVGDALLDGVGIYLDNTTSNSSISEFCVGPNTPWGVRSEWDHYNALAPFDPALMFPRGLNNTVHHCVIEANFIGVWFDQGTVGSAVHRCILRNYTWAAIAFHHNVATLADWPNYALAPGGAQTGNLFLEAGTCSVVHDQHPNNTDHPLCD